MEPNFRRVAFNRIYKKRHKLANNPPHNATFVWPHVLLISGSRIAIATKVGFSLCVRNLK